MSTPEYITLGYRTAVLSVLLGIAFLVTLTAVIIGSPSPDWWGPAPGLAPAMLYLSFGVALAGVIVFLGLMVAIYGYAPAGRKLAALLALVLTAICVAMVATVYATQLTAIRASVNAGITEGLTPWLYQNTKSPIFALDIFGYGFMGLACLVVAPVFEGGGLHRSIRFLWRLSGAAILLGPLGLLIGLEPLLFLMNLLMSLLLPTVSVLLAYFFKQAERALLLSFSQNEGRGAL